MTSPYQLKVNIAGSWANVVMFPPQRLVEVQLACEQLVCVHLGRIAFRIEQDGRDVVRYSNPPRPGEPFGWYDPATLLPARA